MAFLGTVREMGLSLVLKKCYETLLVSPAFMYGSIKDPVISPCQGESRLASQSLVPTTVVVRGSSMRSGVTAVSCQNLV